MTFWALEDAGIPITDARHGVVARVLAALLKQADALDGSRVRDREEFNSDDWKVWLSMFRAVKADFERTRGLSPFEIVRLLAPPES